MIPRFSLSLSLSSLREISKVLRSGFLTSGPVTQEFETQFAKYVGTKYAVAVSSGTAALHLALLGVEVKPGSEVILPSFTYHAAAAGVLYCNAIPVLVDVNPRTMCIEPEAISEAITGRTRAIIATHFAGHPCNMKAILNVAEGNKLAVIEDAAHACGARYRSKRTGSIGKAGCFSFYPTKPLTTGEGGMISTNDSEIARRARLLRGLATERTGRLHYDVRALGFTYRMSELQASLGLYQLRYLERLNSVMRRRARILKERLRGIPGLILPHEALGAKHVYNLFVVQIISERFGLSRDRVSELLRKRGIETQLHYVPLHRLSFFARNAKFDKRKLKVSESLWRTVLSLPLYPSIRNSELKQISDVLLSCGSRVQRLF